ncbi:MAG: RnfABCDGE type electron transport complex subunit D, partial [Actinomycetota bacterium]|nr:RnfABCDGE type electron transport complex subunit D [Actinomycetota bacterium]
WHEGPVSGASYWANVVASPEVLVFVFFMMSDPQTAPRSSLGRLVYGAVTAVVAAVLLSFQPTEYATKVAILASLTVTCALVPLIERVSARLQRPDLPVSPRSLPLSRRLTLAMSRPAVVAATIIAVAAPLDTAALAGNEQLILIERGQTGDRNAQ